MSLLEKHYTQEHQIFRESIRRYFEKEVTPRVEEWEKAGIVPKSVWKDFGSQGFLCPWLPEAYGGVGADLLYSLISMEEGAKTRFSGFLFFLHSDIIVPYLESFGSEKQKQRWLPGCASGDIITAIAMTEPGTGSDLAAIRTTAVRDGDHYVINGQKTFISNGINCGLVIVVAKTDPAAKPAHAGFSLIVVEDGTPGFEKGRNLEKIGFHSQDTAEMAFTDCRVPAENLLGQEGRGFYYLMKKLQQERLVAAIGAQVMAEEALRLTIDFAKTREAFGKPIGRFQYLAFELAKLATDVELGRTFMESLILDHMEGREIVQKVSMAKYWIAEMLNRVVERGVQFHGGYGYIDEYVVQKYYRDAKILELYEGTKEAEIMTIGRVLQSK